MVVLGLAVAWVLLVQLPVLRIVLGFATGAGSTPLDLLLPADPTFRLSTTASDQVVVGTGETSLPDGTRVQMWATHMGNSPGIDISVPEDAVVRDGAFETTFDLSDWPAGLVMINALVVFDGSQPAVLTTRYGFDGAGMAGPRVVDDDDNGGRALQDWRTIWLGAPPLPVIPGPGQPMARDAGEFADVGPMTTARLSHAAALLEDGRVLIVGGDERCDDACLLRPTAEVFDPAEATFHPTQPMTRGRSHLAASRLPDGRVLVTGGSDAAGDSMASTELYDPATAAFVEAPAMSDRRADHTSTTLDDGRVLIVGGVGSLDDGVLASAEVYDPRTGTFEDTGSLSTPRSSHTATLLRDGRVLITGGVGDLDILATAELYDPETGEFNATGSMTVIRELHAATLLDDGRVLIAGGLGPEDQWQLSSAEMYDPVAGTFRATGSMAEGRNFLTMTLLGDGRALVAGGIYKGDSSSKAELYDPTTGVFEAAGNLRHATDGPTATLLRDGSVLLAGGYGNQGDYGPRAETYRPKG